MFNHSWPFSFRSRFSKSSPCSCHFVWILRTKLLHTETFTHRRFCTEKFIDRDAFTKEKRFQTEAFTQRSFYTEKLLHRQVLSESSFTQRSYTQTSSSTQRQQNLQLQNQISVPKRTKVDFEALFQKSADKTPSPSQP